MRPRRRLGLALVLGICVAGGTTRPPLVAAAEDELRKLEHDGHTRTYLLHIPERAAGHPAPLVIALHGGFGTGAAMAKLTGLRKIADREGFVVAFPDGLYRNWNDGRVAEASHTHRAKTDDVGFIDAMIDRISAEVRIDAKRVFLTGISNGAIFSHTYAALRANRVAAIAPVVGGIAVPFAEHFQPQSPVSVLIIQGADDPLVPYDGGAISGRRRGEIISTRLAVEKWREADHCMPTDPVMERLPDTDPEDGCQTVRSRWSPCAEHSEIELYRLEGGGHTWPGGAQYLPRMFIGSVCRDFDASEVIWQFFARHARP